MNLAGWMIGVLLLVAVLYLWRPIAGYFTAVIVFLAAAVVYYWSGLSWQVYAWSWALPLAAGLIVSLPSLRWLYVFLSRKINGWSRFTLEIRDSNGHLHYVKRINEGTYINGGSGSGKTASVNRAYAVHAAQFGMSTLVHDLKKYELSKMLYPIFRSAGMDYHVFAPFDVERSVRINPIAPEYIPDEASLQARVKSFILAAQGRESSDSTADFFNNASCSLLEALIWYLKVYKPESCNLPFVMSILCNPENLHLQNGKKSIPYGKLERLLRQDPKIYQMAASFFQGMGNANTTSNILQTLILALNIINTDAGFFLLSDNDVDLHINKVGLRVALGLVNAPENATAYAPLLGMAADAVLMKMCRSGSSPGMVLLDEVAEIPSHRLMHYIAYVRSLGVCMVCTTQDMSQMLRILGGKEYNKQTMLSNFAHQFFGRTSNEETAKYYEGMMPQVDRTEHSYSTSSSGGSSSRRTVKKPLYERTEFFSFLQGEFAYFHGKVSRFRFRYIKGAEGLPPKIRTADGAMMHQIASRIRQEANEFMDTFSLQEYN